ncbi:uncharacterized protein LOC110849070 isoform X2 [Folsomia candida]|uniref:uncharacterized protein LOC110849070 isoform X2 n=1 Tax=Folsomia candida TaxID=158441 RepID=UPI000B8FEFAC|nr:uncharacterized protein LOC110849070 isoform X2 [Folsomia candida]
MAAVIGSMLNRKQGSKRKGQQQQRRPLDRSELQPHRANITIKPFPQFPPKWLTGKEAEEAMKAKAAHETIKKILIGKELLHQKSKQSFDALSQISYNDDEDSGKGGLSNAYSAIYIGLILICIGIVITFVGLGEKGFKTLQLKLIGPILCIIGLTCIVLKVIQCTFPNLFVIPMAFRKKLGDKEKTSLMEKGDSKHSSGKSRNSRSKTKKGANSGEENEDGEKNNKHENNSQSTPKIIPSPRVTLQSSKKSVRPRSTIPNYIEASSDEDDFDPQRKWRKSDTALNQEVRKIMQVEPLSDVDAIIQNMTPASIKKKSATPPALLSSGESGAGENVKNQKKSMKEDEIVLNPRGLLL